DPAPPSLHEERTRGEGAGGLAEARAEIRQGDAERLPARARIHEEGEGTGPDRRRSHHGRVRGKRPRRRARRRRMMGKSTRTEIRMPKEIRNPNAESRIQIRARLTPACARVVFGFRASAFFRISDFGLRILRIM